MTRDARKEHFMLVDMDGYICLFTNARLDRDTIPKDLYCYDVRDDDSDGTFAQVQRFVMVNHWGTIISKEPIPMNKFHCYWPNRDAFYIPNASLTLDTFHNTPLWDLLEPCLSPEGKDAIANRLPDLISDIKKKTFQTRTGEEQEHLLDYWLFHSKELPMPAHEFLGMTADQYQAWQEGSLRLNDGSYHEMEGSHFRLSDHALLIARQLLHAGGIEQNSSSQAIQTMDGHADPLLSQFVKHLPEDQACILSSFYDSQLSNLILYDPGDDLVALITPDEILYKEDFAQIMKSSGLNATNREWRLVWKQFSETFRTSAEAGLSISAQVQDAVSKVQGNLTRELIRQKSDLDHQISSADVRVSDPVDPHPSKPNKDQER